ncbi:MAG TPA: DUF808 domain-containing protein [Gammaproteobacteria bacterium]|nr:DUF808 domain-containing protein [Gammaproteobacteria bacterium]
MASGFFALFDDIALLLDDIATMGKVASKKTAGILADDLAVNAEKASGFAASREIPVLWAIAKGSLLNKIIILPFIFLLSAYASWLIVPILMVGGLYLAYEGVEKIYEYLVPHERDEERKSVEPALSRKEILEREKAKIKSAIITDFILSLEIVIIALETVLHKPLAVQVVVVSAVALLATVGIYGIVALIVRMDDFGYRLLQIDGSPGKIAELMGRGLISALPRVIRLLSVVGTLAMLLVAGGIYLHNVERLEQLFHPLPSVLASLIVGLVAGAVAFFPARLLTRPHD